MQTRQQAKAQADAERAAAAIAAVVPLAQAPARSPSPFSSTLSSLTPTPSGSFVAHVQASDPQLSPVPTSNNNDAHESTRPAAVIARAFGLPHFPAPNELTTPQHSINPYYPPEVFETPRAPPRRHVPTERELRTAEWARDVEVANGMQLTRTGTLLVSSGTEVEGEEGEEIGKGTGLGSAFHSPVQRRDTSRALRRVQPVKTRVINPETGEFL
ncbi:hypothetical protein HMN09_00944500 [Mycena chlorophos]|uniref:Uncharacterized protein n=1 Tax=Mycena chlorophos TaxID=658473 RepID=A0A8H6SML1_MYCCL|nr:hypothetical protein HMN09_00944500 [Mycena chlorophos]